MEDGQCREVFRGEHMSCAEEAAEEEEEEEEEERIGERRLSGGHHASLKGGVCAGRVRPPSSRYEYSERSSGGGKWT